MTTSASAASGKRFRVELITAESASSRLVRHRRLIRFPQLTMPLLAAYTPAHWDVSHTDEIVQRVDFAKRVDVVAITANTPAAPHAYQLAHEFRARGVKVVIGGPHATLLPDEVAQHADAVVVGEGELVWPQLLADFERGALQRMYRSCALPTLKQMPAPRWDLIKGRAYGRGVTIATRGCPFACDYCTIPQMYQRRMRYRPVGEIVDEIKRMPGRALIFWDDNLGANRDYAKELFTPSRRSSAGGPASVRRMWRRMTSSCCWRPGAAARHYSWDWKQFRKPASTSRINAIIAPVNTRR